MKKVLIISPYFPPVNAADMQRVRTSLPYFEEQGWTAEVVSVDPRYVDMVEDELLRQSVPQNIKVHEVKAFDKKLTSKLGLGSIALRSLWFYKQKVDQLLKNNDYDLIYFSTTQYPVCILGAYWKKRYGVPYVIDLQDPWHTDYYQDKPKDERPPKYWFSYRLNKYTEAMAMKKVGGLISVSQEYIDKVKQRYLSIQAIPEQVITFGAEENDFSIAATYKDKFKPLLDPNRKNLVYIGRGGADMHKALVIVFKALQKGLHEYPELFARLHLTFIGTSYAPAGQGKPTISPLASEYGLTAQVTEHTDRISYHHTLNILADSDALLVPGSDSQGYTASKLYPYLGIRKPLLALLNEKSPGAEVLTEFGAPYLYSFNEPEKAVAGAFAFLKQLAEGTLTRQCYHEPAIRKYSAQNLTAQQCRLFDQVIASS